MCRTYLCIFKLSTDVTSRVMYTTYCLWLLVGCEVTPEVNISAQKYIIKVFVPTQDSLSEVWIRADSVRICIMT